MYRGWVFYEHLACNSRVLTIICRLCVDSVVERVVEVLHDLGHLIRRGRVGGADAALHAGLPTQTQTRPVVVTIGGGRGVITIGVGRVFVVAAETAVAARGAMFRCQHDRQGMQSWLDRKHRSFTGV